VRTAARNTFTIFAIYSYLLYHDVKCTIVIGQTRITCREQKANDDRLAGHQMLPMLPGIDDSHALARVFLIKKLTQFYQRYTPNVMLMCMVHLFSERRILNISLK